MDPNEALNTMRESYRALTGEKLDRDVEIAHLYAVAHAFRDLDNWLSRGGFLPDPWQAGRLLVPAPAYLDDDSTRSPHRQEVPEVGHGLDWADNGTGYSGRCDCGDWSRTDVETFDLLLAFYAIHLRDSGVPDHRKATT